MSPDRLLLASTSAQRRAILEQLAIPFDVVSPRYVEDDPLDADPVELVRRHAEGKAHSVHADGHITLGVDTTVVLDRRLYGRRPTPRRPPTCSTSSRGAPTGSSPGCASSAWARTSSRTS
jgi:septum formation protein